MASQNFSSRIAIETLSLLQQLIRAYPPPFEPQPTDLRSTNSQATLRDYLIHYGYLSPDIVLDSIDEEPMVLADGLLRVGTVPSRVLSVMMLVEMVDRLLSPDRPERLRLGELLLLDSKLSSFQLAMAIETQLRLRLTVSNVPLGQLLISMGYISETTLQEVLALQQQQERICKTQLRIRQANQLFAGWE